MPAVEIIRQHPVGAAKLHSCDKLWLQGIFCLQFNHESTNFPSHVSSYFQSKPILVDPIDFEGFITKNKTLIQNDPQRELLLYPNDDVAVSSQSILTVKHFINRIIRFTGSGTAEEVPYRHQQHSKFCQSPCVVECSEWRQQQREIRRRHQRNQFAVCFSDARQQRQQ